MTSALPDPVFEPVAQPVLANLGCGPRAARRPPAHFNGWRQLRVDADAAVEPDLVADLCDLSPIASGSVQGVWTSHCLEHLPQRQVGTALGEMRRILSDDGFACILVPDLQTIAAIIAGDRLDEPIYISPAGPVSPHDVVFGFGPALERGCDYMAHRCGFTPSSLKRALSEAGFTHFLLFRRPDYELAAVAHKTGWTSAQERDRLIARLGL